MAASTVFRPEGVASIFNVPNPPSNPQPISGSLIHIKDRQYIVRPLRIVLIESTGLFGKSIVAETWSKNGEFFFVSKDLAKLAGHKVELKVLLDPWNLKSKTGEEKYVELFKQEIQVPSGKDALNLSDLPINFTEYQTEFPRIDPMDKKVSDFQPVPIELKKQFESKTKELLLPILIALFGDKFKTTEFSKTFEKFFFGKQTSVGQDRLEWAKEVQEFYTKKTGKTFTMQQEEEKPGTIFSPEFQGQIALQSGAQVPLRYKRDQEGNIIPRHYVEKISFEGLEFDGQYIPIERTKAEYEMDKEGNLIQTRVKVTQRIWKERNKTIPPVSSEKRKNLDYVTSAAATKDEPLYRDLSTIHRTAASLRWQLQHLATHIDMEQYNVAAERNLSNDNPVTRIIRPSLGQTPWINREAQSQIFEKKGALERASHLTPESVNESLKRLISSVDPLAFKPRKPYENSKFDLYANIANPLWNLFYEHCQKKFGYKDVDGQWVKGSDHEELVKHWAEIYGFSKDLVEHSLPFTVRDAVMEPEKVFVDSSEFADPNKLRPFIKGSQRSISPITGSNIYEEGAIGQADIERLTQICTYILYTATFKHSWMHNLQAMYLGQAVMDKLIYQVMCLDMNEKGQLMFPEPSDLLKEKFIVHVLVALTIGYFVKNEFGDIDPELIEKVKLLSKELDAKLEKETGVKFNLAEFLRSQINS